MSFPTLSRPVRRWTLVLHVVVSVGWLGVDLALLTLGATALLTDDPELSHAAYVGMDVVGGTLLVPIALLALATGVVLSLGTKWGLVRHWWVLVKFAVTTLAATLTIVLLRPGLDEAARVVGEDLERLRVNLVVAPSVALTLYLTTTVLSVLKPWGRTRWDRSGTVTSGSPDRLAVR
jgi:hypothetical protein